MLNDLPLFDPRIAAKSVDPWTSHDAAEKAVSLVAQHHKAILRYLDGIFPRAAHYKDIAVGTGLEPVQIGRRMGELRDARLVEDVGTAPVGPRTHGTLWRIVPFQEAA